MHHMVCVCVMVIIQIIVLGHIYSIRANSLPSISATRGALYFCCGVFNILQFGGCMGGLPNRQGFWLYYIYTSIIILILQLSVRL